MAKQGAKPVGWGIFIFCFFFQGEAISFTPPTQNVLNPKKKTPFGSVWKFLYLLNLPIYRVLFLFQIPFGARKSVFFCLLFFHSLKGF